jgi:hypothetical protein
MINDRMQKSRLLDILTPYDADPKGKGADDTHKRLVLVAIAAVLVVIAITVLLVGTVVGSTGVGACNRTILETERDQCFASLASATSNYSVCLLIKQNQSSYQCISAVAQKRQDAGICFRINSSSALYTSCLEGVGYSTDNVSDCLGLNNSSRSSCAYNIALMNNFNNIGYCGDIPNITKNLLCYHMYYYNLAVSSRTPLYCTLLPSVSDYNLSTQMLSQSSSNLSQSLNYSSYYSLNITPQSFCFYRLATLTRNQTLCRYTTGAIASLCGGASAPSNNTLQSATNVTGMCSSVPSYAQDLCYYAIATNKAVAERNTSECGTINSTAYQYSCFSTLAIDYGNTTYCNYITGNSTQREACVESTNILASNITK